MTASTDITKAAEGCVDAIFEDIRDRRFLKWLFNQDGDGLIGYLNGQPLTSLDLEVQGEIRAAWEGIVKMAIASERERCAIVADAQAVDWLQGVKKANSVEALNYANGRKDGAQVIAAAIRKGEA
jgi:hypothetical protein